MRMNTDETNCFECNQLEILIDQLANSELLEYETGLKQRGIMLSICIKSGAMNVWYWGR